MWFCSHDYRLKATDYYIEDGAFAIYDTFRCSFCGKEKEVPFVFGRVEDVETLLAEVDNYKSFRRKIYGTRNKSLGR